MARVTAPAPRKVLDCLCMPLPKGKKKQTITVAPASICRRVIQHMCFQRAGREGDLPLTYFLLLLEVLISTWNSASRQKLSLGSGFTSALLHFLHRCSHRFQPNYSRFIPVPATGRSDLILLPAKKIAVCLATDFGQAGGLPAAFGAHRCAYAENTAAVSTPQHTTPKPKQHADGHTLFFSPFFIHKEVVSALGTALT